MVNNNPGLGAMIRIPATHLFFKFVLDRPGNSNLWISLQFVPQRFTAASNLASISLVQALWSSDGSKHCCHRFAHSSLQQRQLSHARLRSCSPVPRLWYVRSELLVSTVFAT